ncbi:MAG: ketoacyl-ACP synthase III [Desulfobacteraceae bacterium]|nr:MAG: ketoacyl-ACP synthase III [Desulfobacteraceae bacterium]
MSDHPRLGISRIETYLPPCRLSSRALADEFGFDLEFIEKKVGVKQLFAVRDESVGDLAVQALSKLLESVPFLSEQLDILVVCTQTPDYQLPQVSSLVQSRCKLKSSLLSFDISLGCSGFVYGLSVVESLMARHGMRNGVLITAETYSKVIDPGDRNTKCLFSDGAAATLITLGGNIGLGEFRFGTDGDHYDNLIIRVPSEGERAKLFMDGRGIYTFALSTIPNEVRSTCKINNVDLKDVDFFVFHQASKFLLDGIGKKLELESPDRLVNVLHLYGNTVSSSIPMALKDTLSVHGTRQLTILISGFGVGLSWATTILRTEGDCSDV